MSCVVGVALAAGFGLRVLDDLLRLGHITQFVLELGTIDVDGERAVAREANGRGVLQGAAARARDAGCDDDGDERDETTPGTKVHGADGTGAASTAAIAGALGGTISSSNESSPSTNAEASRVTTGTTIASGSTVAFGAIRFSRAS